MYLYKCLNFFQVKKKCQPLILNNDQLLRVKEILLENIQRGLKKDTHSDSIVKCFPTYVQDLPNGKGNSI